MIEERPFMEVREIRDAAGRAEAGLPVCPLFSGRTAARTNPAAAAVTRSTNSPAPTPFACVGLGGGPDRTRRTPGSGPRPSPFPVAPITRVRGNRHVVPQPVRLAPGDVHPHTPPSAGA